MAAAVNTNLFILSATLSVILAFYHIFIPLKKGIMFLTEPLGLSVFVSVCLSVIMIVARWLDLAT